MSDLDLGLNKSKNQNEIATQTETLFQNFSVIATSWTEDQNALKNREFNINHENKVNDFTFNEIKNCNNNHKQFFVKAGYDDVCVNDDDYE